jgi:pimeloyl-ACP methyl ester carboxylesterase
VRDVADADTEFKGMNVFRFEHDTWLGVETNARQLASFVSNAIRTRVSFVAHSRGGLVAARAAGLVASSVGVEAVVTLGTPFAGTPLAGGAPLAWSAVHALMGGLRYLGGPVVDVMTRLASLALRSAPPEGITDMKQNSLGLGLLRQYPHAGLLTVAGVASNATDRHGLAGFRQGVGNGAFGGEPNDLVVAEASALGGVPGTTIASDHYSYLEDQPEVNSLLWRAICLTDNPARLCRDLPVSTKDKIARLRALAPHPTLEKGVMGTPPNPE